MGNVIELSQSQLFSLVAAGLSAVGSFVFALLCWLVKYSLRREIARMDALTKQQSQRNRKQAEFNNWVITTLAYHRLFGVGEPPYDSE